MAAYLAATVAGRILHLADERLTEKFFWFDLFESEASEVTKLIFVICDLSL